MSERVIRALEAHIAATAHDVGECERIAQRSGQPVVQLLLGLVVDDERRHQLLLRELIKYLEQDAVARQPAVASALEAAPEVASSVRAMIRDQEQGARYLRHLARQEPALYDGVYSVLLATIARDSEKHAQILRYLLRRFEAPSA